MMPVGAASGVSCCCCRVSHWRVPVADADARSRAAPYHRCCGCRGPVRSAWTVSRGATDVSRRSRGPGRAETPPGERYRAVGRHHPGLHASPRPVCEQHRRVSAVRQHRPRHGASLPPSRTAAVMRIPELPAPRRRRPVECHVLRRWRRAPCPQPRRGCGTGCGWRVREYRRPTTGRFCVAGLRSQCSRGLGLLDVSAVKFGCLTVARDGAAQACFTRGSRQPAAHAWDRPLVAHMRCVVRGRAAALAKWWHRSAAQAWMGTGVRFRQREQTSACYGNGAISRRTHR